MKKSIRLIIAILMIFVLAGCKIDNTPSTKWVSDETGHWHETTTNGETTKTDFAAHTFIETVVKEATCTEDGLKKYTCSVCKYSYEEAIPMKAHEYDETTWKYNEEGHWHECACGHKEEVFAHSFTETVTKEATYEEAGEKTFTCECGYSYTEVIPMLVNPYAFKDVDLDKVSYQLVNGNFENDYEGWYMSDTDKEAYTINDSPVDLWNNPVNATGKYLYGYTIESAKVVFHSSLFKIGGIGLITFKMAGNGTNDLKVAIKEYNPDGDDTELVCFNNWYYTNSHESGFIFRNYFLELDLDTYKDKVVYLEVSDQKENDFGFICLDDIVTYYEALPEFTGAWYKAAFVDEPENATIVPHEEVETSQYQLINGDFENGWEGWNVDDAVKAVYSINNSPTDIWNNPNGFTGNYLYGFYNEAGTTTFTSTTFKAGGTGLITFRMAGNCTDNLQLVLMKKNADAEDVEIAKFNNWYFGTVAESGFISHPYYYQLDMEAYTGAELYFKVVDNATANFAFISLDDIVTYYEENPDLTGVLKAGFVSEPEEDVTEFKLVNGDFENGWEGWNVDDAVKAVYSINNSPTDIWNNPNGFTGNYLYGFYNEAGTTTFTSTTFKAGGTGLITFRMAGNCTDNLQFVLMKKNADAEDTEIAKFNNWYFGIVAESGFISHVYYYQLDMNTYGGAELYFKVVDNATANFAFISLDDIVTYYKTNPDLTSMLKAGFCTAPAA